MQIAKIKDLPGRDNSIIVKKIVIHAMGEFIEQGKEDYYAPDFLRKIGLSAHFFVTAPQYSRKFVYPMPHREPRQWFLTPPRLTTFNHTWFNKVEEGVCFQFFNLA